jgi:UV DNA damage endonuclease
MKIRLGYACLPVSINETSSSMLAYTYFKRLGSNGYNKLNEIILSNFKSLKEILKYNISNEIYVFRITSNLFPLATHPHVSLDLKKYQSNLEEIGNIINQNNIRVSLHLDPYYVLNSIRDDVVSSTINILTFYQNMFKYMNVDYKIVTHVGGKTGGKKQGMKRFINHFSLLNDEIKKHIILENDDKVYNIRNVLSVCKKINIPFVLDYHHFMCNKNNEKIEDYLDKIFDTWDTIPKIHFSSPKSKKEKRAHHDYIDVNMFVKFLDKVKKINKDIDIMIEAKAKDEALFRLVRQLKYLGYKVEGTIIFL